MLLHLRQMVSTRTLPDLQHNDKRNLFFFIFCIFIYTNIFLLMCTTCSFNLNKGSIPVTNVEDHLCLCFDVIIYVLVYVCKYVFKFVSMHARMCVLKYICVYLSMYGWMDVRTCVCIILSMLQHICSNRHEYYNMLIVSS